jgi:hypothetical protein
MAGFCGVDASGTVLCNSLYPPTALTGSGALTGVKFLTPYSNHACALMTDSSVACYGANPSGELGNGATSTATALTPVKTLGLPGTAPLMLGPAQAIVFSVAPALSVGGFGTVSALPSGGSSANPVVLSNLTPSVCALNGTTVTALAAGTCTIAADQAGDVNYTAAPQVTQSILVSPAPQVITVGSTPPVTVGTGGALSATGGASGNPVSFTSNTTGICAVAGASVSGVSVGQCAITATQLGTSNYLAAAPVTFTVTVGQGTQNIVFGAPLALAVGGSGTVTATGGGSGLPVVFTTLTPATCTVSGSLVSALAVGTCTIAANQGGSVNYLAAAQQTQSVTVGQVAQSIAFGTAPVVVVGGTGTVSASSPGSSGNPITFTSLTGTTCSITGTAMQGLATGACTIAANQAGNANFAPAPQQTQTFTIGQGVQLIAFGAPPALLVGGTATLTATGGASGNPVTITSLSPTTCTVAGSVVTGVAVGPCSIAGNQAANANYAAAVQKTLTLTVGQGTQTILFPAIPDQTLPTIAFALSATGGASGNSLVYSSLTPLVCVIGGGNGNLVAPYANGVCTIAVNQAGNANYLAATQVTQSFNVGAPQTIVFATPPTTLLTASPLLLTATGGASGNPVTFSSSTPAICAAAGTNGATLVLFGAGTCTVIAQQAGTVSYLPASVTRSFQVVLGFAQSIGFTGPPSSALAASPLALVATGGASGNPVVFSSTTPTVCATGGSNGSSLTLVSPGACTVVANQAGNANYLAASSVIYTFIVLQNPQVIVFGALPSVLPTALPFTISASGGGSGNPVVFTSSTFAVCATGGLNGTTVVLFGTTGTCTIAANQAGNGNYLAAAPVTQSFSVAVAATPGASGDVPLPPWAYVLLAAGLMAAMWWQRRAG